MTDEENKKALFQIRLVLATLCATTIVFAGWNFAYEPILAIDTQLNFATVVMGNRIKLTGYKQQNFGNMTTEHILLDDAHYLIVRGKSSYCIAEGLLFRLTADEALTPIKELPPEAYRVFQKGCMALEEYNFYKNPPTVPWAIGRQPAITKR